MNALTTTIGQLESFSEEQAQSTAMHLARTYQQATEVIAKCFAIIDEQTEILAEEFGKIKDDGLHLSYHRNDFSVKRTFNYGHSYSSSDDTIFKDMKQQAWRIMIDALGIKQVMSIKKREEFQKQLSDGDLPDISEETIAGIISGLVGQAQEFATDAAKEVFDILRPTGSWSGGQYKTNNAFRVGKKVILTYCVERSYGKGFRPTYRKEAMINAIDGVFHILDGKGVLKEYPGPLMKAMLEAADGKGETEYFKFKCFKNNNLHLEFKRLDLVKELNYLAAGEKVLGKGD